MNRDSYFLESTWRIKWFCLLFGFWMFIVTINAQRLPYLVFPDMLFHILISYEELAPLM